MPGTLIQQVTETDIDALGAAAEFTLNHWTKFVNEAAELHGVKVGAAKKAELRQALDAIEGMQDVIEANRQGAQVKEAEVFDQVTGILHEAADIVRRCSIGEISDAEATDMVNDLRERLGTLP
jgi:hypothetical protein